MLTKRDNLSLGSAGLATGTGAGTFKTTTVLDYMIAGRAYQKAATDNIAMALRVKSPAEVAVNVPASKTQVYFFLIDAAGAITYTQARQSVNDSGNVRGMPGSASAANYQASAVEWPLEEDGRACIGAVKVATNASGAFIPGTTSFGAANQTVTFYNVAGDYGVPIPV
jgi:hypothetical protein